MIGTIETTEDAFLGGRLMIRQPKRGYRAGIDAVFLAASVQARGAAQRILDVGAGVGTVGLCAARRCVDARVVLLEPQTELAALALENAARNDLANRVTVVEASIGASASAMAAACLEAESFDRVLANPPYHAEGRGTPAPNALKATSHAMPEASLDDWVRFMARMAKPGGTATVIHKAEALGEVLAAFGSRFGGLRVLCLHPREGEAAIRVLVSGIKGSRAPLTVLAPLVLHQHGNGFTPVASAVLRDGAALPVEE